MWLNGDPLQFYSSFQNDIQGGWTAALKQIYKIKTQLSECEGDGISESDLSRNDYISDIINNCYEKVHLFYRILLLYADEYQRPGNFWKG